MGFTYRTRCNTLRRFQGWNLAASTSLWEGMRRVLMTPAGGGQTDRQPVNLCISFFWRRGKKSKELQLSFDSMAEIPGTPMRQRKSKVCSLTHEIPTFAGKVGPKPETRFTLTLPIIHHNKMTAVELAIQTVSSEIKDMTQWALPHLLSRKVYRFPWIHLSFLTSGGTRT